MALRPALRPGAPLLRRDATHLQVGTSPGIVLADRPGLLAFLRLLDGARDLARLEVLAHERVPELQDDVTDLVSRLLAAGAVVDTSAARPRGAYELAVGGDPAAAELVDATRSILSASGLHHLDSTEPDLLVLVSCGEPARAVFEHAALWDVTHLPVVIDEDRVRIGPLVRPGRTPGLCCHDLHRADFDPAWPALLHQLGAISVTAGGLAATTAHAAAVEVAAEIIDHLDGRPPRTIGHCLLVGPRHDERIVRPVPFHPRCTCDLLRAA
ncbi:hypothetical protein [Aeromicrobium chenweiae]|uniref:Uncharacterized protein n=1 Tax=Aeromicrobium chenweiae TaxID=2079793 RepID=A0A2S0WP81_9ACTN|nr:hypothetical protein [Aeromicrobium chenweiae]AWB93145.1 hypothetical protein C3E78_13550 [Aeromicrobium chenweiae]TGN34135.1 hypothetical protein E4L97_03585 [Aeromicrobium chenweiae]